MLTELEINNMLREDAVSDDSSRKFEIVYPMRLNILDQGKHFRKDRLPERYNTEDNIYQYFQNIGGDLMTHALAGMINKGQRFWVAGKIPEAKEWPVFACALDKITPTYAEIGLVTFMVFEDEYVTRKKRLNFKNFLNGNLLTPDGKAIQHVILSEPYATKTQYDGVYYGGNMMEAFCRMNVFYKLSNTYIESETKTFGCQNGYSAMGFIKKAIVDIISAILTKKIEQGSLFRIQSRRENSTYCLLRYYGINVTSDTIYFTALSVSSDVNESNAPIISIIDTGENAFTSKQLDQKRREQIMRIDADILDKASNFEQGQEFKMDDKYRMAPHEKKEIGESINIEKRVIRLNESQLRNIIKESITNILNEGFFNKIFSKNREASNGKQDWAPFNVVRKALLTAAENAIKAIIHDRLKGRGQPISINRIEVAHMMLSEFEKDEDYYKKYVPISCVCKLNWYLTTGNEPEVLNAIKQAYDNIRKKMMAGQPL